MIVNYNSRVIVFHDCRVIIYDHDQEIDQAKQ